MLSTKEGSKKLILERETFWIDTLDTLEPQGLNRKRSQYIVKNSQNGEILPFVVPFFKNSKHGIAYHQKTFHATERS